MRVISLRGSCLIFAVVVLLPIGCGGPGPGDMSKERLESMAGGPLAEVVPVSGKILVNGEPKPGVNLYLYASEGGKVIGRSTTDAEGVYCWSTYLSCDGLKPGSYRIGFRYIPKPKKNDSDESKLDQFKSKYSNPMKVEYLLTVVAGTPQVDVNYDLKME